MNERNPENKMDKTEKLLGVLAVPLILSTILFTDVALVSLIEGRTFTDAGALLFKGTAAATILDISAFIARYPNRRKDSNS